MVGGEEIKLFSSDYGSAQIIEESEYLRKHASHLQVLLLMSHFCWVIILFLGLGSIFPSLCSINCFPLPPVQQIQVKIRKEKERLRVKIISREHFCELKSWSYCFYSNPKCNKKSVGHNKIHIIKSSCFQFQGHLTEFSVSVRVCDSQAHHQIYIFEKRIIKKFL